MDLTVQDIHNFVNAVNAGREAVGLPVLSQIDYDDCVPSAPFSCLSAHHLFHADPLGGSLGGRVGTEYVRDLGGRTTGKLANALNTAVVCGELTIPDSIRAVTDEFDQSTKGSPGWLELRQLFVEAGYIED